MTLERHADRYAEGGGHVLFLALLLVGLAQTMAGTAPIAVGGKAAVFVGVAVVAGWYAYGAIAKARGDLRVSPAVWVSILTALWVMLAFLCPAFVWIAFVLAMLCWHFLRAPASVIAELVIAGTSIGATLLHNPSVAVGGIIGPTIGIATAVAVTGIYHRISQMVDERDALVDDLITTRELLAQKERQAGVLAERERLGGEIHDGTGQSLASIILLLRSATSPDTSENQREVQVQTALATAQAALAESRRFLLGLDAPTLAPAQLTEAVEAHAVRATELGVPAEVQVHGTAVALGPDTANALLRAAQEALTNAVKHSRATQVRVTITYLPDEVHLDVVDNGIGLDPSRPSNSGRSGFGLRAMKNRVSEAGGSVSIEFSDGGGTTVHAQLPIGSAA
ncbi:sensor histidine kinase [Gordonia sp. (in: high G+C Gram-positive bacteria)]|uniref:sensor histidine kinase n=1 Tax=Gordonia sp. (in: high G+C Gram-positive bacteria) TaxID=84139 RepID=UPI003C72C560